MILTETLNKIINSSSDFAIWQLPNSLVVHGIISLNKSEHTTANIEEDEGFVISKFDNNDSYYLIKNDISFRIENDKLSVVKGNIDQIESGKIEIPSEEISQTSENDFVKNVTNSLNEIEGGSFDKVVISKYRDIKNSINNVANIFESLRSSYPNAMVYLSRVNQTEFWIGATPETLLSYDEDKTFKTVALAGTQPTNDLDPKEATWGIKEIEEQAFVSRYIIDCFKRIRLRQYVEKGPKTIKAGNLFHLITSFTVHNQKTKLDNLAQKMLDLLHPTSAVCGMPLRESKEFILVNEKHDRSFYSGYLGPVNFEGNTHLFVNLRCAKIYTNKLRLFSGAGITEDSIPEKEWIETELKCDILANKI